MDLTSYYTVDGEIIGESTNGTRLDYLTDALGSVTAKVDQAGSVASSARYKPYGDQLSGSSYAFGWVGSYGYRKAVNGSYVRARHYSKNTGNWTTVDLLWPKELAFCYVRGRVQRNSDPSGLGPDDLDSPDCNTCGGEGGMTKAKLDMKKFCEAMKSSNTCLWKCNLENNLNIQLSCLQDWCKSKGTVTCSSNCQDKFAFACPTDCGCNPKSITMPACGETPCSKQSIRVVYLCCKSTTAEYLSRCGCKGNQRAGHTIDCFSGDMPATNIILHELVHFCGGEDCQKHPPEYKEPSPHTKWAKCIASCLGLGK